MPKNTKDSNDGKKPLAKDTDNKSEKRSDKGSADQKSKSPTGSQDKGEKKTTP